MKKESKFKVENCILIPIILFAIISIVTIYCTRDLLASDYQNLFIKQGLWYLLGFAIAYVMMLFGNKFLYNNAYIFYIVGVVLLILVLFLGKPINNARCWFIIPYIGSFQPSEFMKIFLIITLSRMINDFNEERRSNDISEEFKFLIKVLIVVGIPSILTFIEPDTGAVLIYFIITIVMLFVGGFRSRWFIITIGTIVVLGGMFLGLYFLKQDLFIKIFGTSFFYRVERLITFKTMSSYQLENALIAMGSSSLFGTGLGNVSIYIPEAPTDFVFAFTISNFGYFTGFLILICYLFMDIFLINKICHMKKNTIKYILISFTSIFIFGQIINIGMNLGLVPIIGIPLPFLSYGGSTLIIYFLFLSIVFANEKPYRSMV